MSRQSQKDQERIDIDLFLRLSGIKHTFCDLNCEKPDCDIQIENKTIGIEVTEFVRSKEYCDKVRSVNATLKRIREETECLIASLTNTKLTINYSQQSPVSRKIGVKDREGIVTFLASHLQKKEVQDNINEGPFHIEYEYEKLDNEFIESVRISTYPGKKTLEVTENKLWLTGVIPKKDLEAIIRDKEGKMNFQRNNETWLLMVVAETEYSCGIIKSDVLEYVFNSCLFNRIFMLERFSKNLYELKVCL